MQRVLREDEAYRLLAHFVSTAELHTIEPPHYADRRMLEGVVPLLEALIRDGDDEGRDWLEAFKGDLQSALAARRRDPDAYEAFLHAAPGRIAQEIKRRGLLGETSPETARDDEDGDR